MITLITRFHQWLYIRSDGRIGHHWLGPPSLLLTTVGRKSGQQRTRALVYTRHGDELGLVASWGGRPKHPAWYHNLTADPHVSAQIGRTTGHYLAREVHDTERDEWLARADAVNKDRYSGYIEMTDRHIPVIVLTPETKR